MTKLSVNVLVWNNKDTILKLLEAVKSDVEGIDHEYIIVDNGSKDGCDNLIGSWITSNLSDNFNFVRHQENLGISVGKNRGIGLSRGEYILMLDGDVVPVANSIPVLISWLEENKDKHAIGMLPNKFVTSPDMAEKTCEKLVEVKEHKCCCLYYGLFRRSMFTRGLRMCEEGEMGKPGYGWEDHDFYKRMQRDGITQYAGEINKHGGRYFHAINSSVRAMGREAYMETSRLRSKQFKEIWESSNAVGQSADQTPRRSRRVGSKN
jgi:glycosyltransferase involved in cell wall biosynthesis